MMIKWLAGVCALIALALAVPAVRHLRERPPAPPPTTRLQIPLPAGVSLGSGQDGLDAAIAPDERHVVVVATKDGEASLWELGLGDGAARAVPTTLGAALPAWRSDGDALAFFAGGELRVRTWSSQRTSIVTTALRPGGVSWLADGSLVFAADTGTPIRRWTDNGAHDVTALRPGDAGHAWPFIDDAGQLVYVALRQDGTRVARRQKLVTREDGTLTAPDPPIDLSLTTSHAEVHRNVLVHVRDGVLLAQRLDETGTKLVGRSAALATGVGVSALGRGTFAASARLAIWSAQRRQATVLTWHARDGRRRADATEPGDFWQVRLSPDGRDVAATLVDPLLRTLDVQAIPLAAPGTARRISLSIGPDSEPVWSPDGASIVYRSVQSGPGALMSRPSGRSSAAETTVLRSAADLTPSDWRGDRILFHASTAEGTRVMALERRLGTQVAVTAAGFKSWDARWSPDGRWIAYVSDEGGQPDVYVQAWPTGTPRTRATFGGGQRPQWGRDGALYFMRADTVMRAGFVAATAVVSTPQPLLRVDGLRDFALSATGDRLLVVGAVRDTEPPAAFVVLDWLSSVPPPPQPPPRL